MIGCIIQARMGSERLFGKVMMKVDKKNPLIYYVLNQIQNCKLLDDLVVATTSLKQDDIIENYIKKMNIKCFRGNSHDVLDRYYQCAKQFSFSAIVRITADCPLIDPTLVDNVIQKFKSDSYDYVANFLPRTFPFGTEAEIFSFQCLELTWKNAKKKSEREHVTPYIYNNKNKFHISSITNSDDLSNLKWSVDRINDLKLVKKIILKIKKRPILMKDILDLYIREPDLSKTNNNFPADEGYIRSVLKD